MRIRCPFLACFILLFAISPPEAMSAMQTLPTAEPFSGTVLVENLEAPWDVIWGPDRTLWITERMGKRVTSVNPKTGEKHTVVTISKAHTGPQHEGLLGIALSQDRQHAFIGYTIMSGNSEYARIVRFEYDPQTHTLVKPQTILDKLPAGNDHNGGRLRLGPDGKLYYSIGEQGHNQGANYCLPIEAQRLPTLQELESQNYDAYRGKVLRLNTDGGIPEDNPVIKGVKSHIFTYGHRNPQGLVFVGDSLFSSEQGPSSDDEINLLVAGGNYGWPHVAGFQDDQAYVYANWSAAPDCASLKYDANTIPAGVPQQKESEWNDESFREPAKTFYTVPNGYNFNDARCAEMPYLCWPTIAPASIAWYPEAGPIPGWSNSLLVTSLKNGALYRLPLNDDKQSVQGDVFKYFHSRNRYRSSLLSEDGKTIYIITDKSGNVLDADGKPSTAMLNPGAVLAFEYREAD